MLTGGPCCNRINPLQQPGWNMRHLYDILLLIGFGFPTLLQLSTRAQPWQVVADLSWIHRWFYVSQINIFHQIGRSWTPKNHVDLWQTLHLTITLFALSVRFVMTYISPWPWREQGLTSKIGKPKKNIPIFRNQKLLDVLNNNADWYINFFETPRCLGIECPGQSALQSAKQI